MANFPLLLGIAPLNATERSSSPTEEGYNNKMDGPLRDCVAVGDLNVRYGFMALSCFPMDDPSKINQ